MVEWRRAADKSGFITYNSIKMGVVEFFGQF